MIEFIIAETILSIILWWIITERCWKLETKKAWSSGSKVWLIVIALVPGINAIVLCSIALWLYSKGFTYK